MSHLAAVAKLIDRAAGQGLVGTPVAVRALLLISGDLPARESMLAQALDAAARWLAATPRELLAQSDPIAGHLSVQVRTEQGATILVAIGPAAQGQGVSAVTLVGNRGVASWEAREGELVGSDATQPAELSPQARALLAAVRKSVAERGVAAVGGEREALAKPQAGNGPVRDNRTQVKHKPIAPPYGILLVRGMQTHQENYAQAFARDPRCRLVGVVDEAGVPSRRRELNAELARAYGIPLFDDLDAALARDDVQAVSVCSSPERRAGVIVRCAEAGKHLYLDKPLAATMAEADRIVAAIDKAGVIHQMFSQVHTPTAERARNLLAADRLGELVAIHFDAYFAKGHAGTAKLGQPRRETRRPAAFETIEAKRELHNVGVYPLVLLRWLLGRDVRRVFATTGNFFFEEHQRLDMEDFAHLTLELEGGLTATVATGRNGWRSHPSGGLNRTWFVGAKGATCLDAHRPRLEVWNDGDPWPMPRRHPEDPMGFWSSTQDASGVLPKRSWLTEADDRDARHFIDCLEQGRASDVTAADGAKALEVILAAYESAATGAAVNLPLARN